METNMALAAVIGQVKSHETFPGSVDARDCWGIEGHALAWTDEYNIAFCRPIELKPHEDRLVIGHERSGDVSAARRGLR